MRFPSHLPFAAPFHWPKSKFNIIQNWQCRLHRKEHLLCSLCGKSYQVSPGPIPTHPFFVCFQLPVASSLQFNPSVASLAESASHNSTIFYCMPTLQQGMLHILCNNRMFPLDLLSGGRWRLFIWIEDWPNQTIFSLCPFLEAGVNRSLHNCSAVFRKWRGRSGWHFIALMCLSPHVSSSFWSVQICLIIPWAA